MTAAAPTGLLAERSLESLGMHSRVAETTSRMAARFVADQSPLHSSGRAIADATITMSGGGALMGSGDCPVYRAHNRSGSRSGWTVTGGSQWDTSNKSQFVTNKGAIVSRVVTPLDST